MILRLTWRADLPPSAPPSECHDADLWRQMHARWAAHQQPAEDGTCQCGERWPCTGLRLAYGGLIHSCTPVLALGDGVQFASVIHKVTTTCRWCRAAIWLHPLHGWLHLAGGLSLCRQPLGGTPALCCAEPTFKPTANQQNRCPERESA